MDIRVVQKSVIYDEKFPHGYKLALGEHEDVPDVIAVKAIERHLAVELPGGLFRGKKNKMTKEGESATK